MNLPQIRIGKFKLSMSQTQLSELLALIDDHAATHGTTHGFISRIIEALRVQK